MDIRVTELKKEDYDKLEDILTKHQLFHYELGKDENWLNVDIAAFRDYMLRRHSLVLVAEDEDNLDKGYIGFIAASGRSLDEELRLQDLYVEETYRSNLIGTLLMQDILHWSEDEGFKDIIVHVTCNNERVFDFYEKFGFVLANQFDDGYELVRK